VGGGFSMSCYLNRGGRLPRAGDGFKTKCCDARNGIFGARADLRKYRKWVKHTSPDAILTDTPVRESRNRVLPPIRNNGFGAPYQRIVINPGPVDVKKEGSAFDLPNGRWNPGWTRTAGETRCLGLSDGRRTVTRRETASRQRRRAMHCRSSKGTRWEISRWS